jgi:hypothetical protein
VVDYHLAARLRADDAQPDQDQQPRRHARALLAQALQADDGTKDWHEAITQAAATARPAEAVLFSDMIWNWRSRTRLDPGALPHVAEYRGQYRYELAARLLRAGQDSDTPARQSYALTAAVLDGLALSEVVAGATTLEDRLARSEQRSSDRRVFAQPFTHWLRHVHLVAAPQAGGQDRTVTVKMPDRELAKTVIELAWLEYDVPRDALITWLTDLCTGHPDESARVRAAQALAYIAAYDYPLIKERALDTWSAPKRPPAERQSAAWLLEALVLSGIAVDKVTALLRQWTHADSGKRSIAVRAYGTKIALAVPQDAIVGVRSCAAQAGLGPLPQRALYNIYSLGLTREVTEEMATWRREFPLMQERAGQALTGIAQICRSAEGDTDGPYDLLWLLTYEREKVGASLTELAELWLLACTRQSSSSDAWQTLGRWAQSCRRYRSLAATFTDLADEFERAADGGDLGGRLPVYRRRWSGYLMRETAQ